jgi:hypothetical protein
MSITQKEISFKMPAEIMDMIKEVVEDIPLAAPKGPAPDIDGLNSAHSGVDSAGNCETP